MTTTPTRDFTVAVFVVHRQHVILHQHRRLGIWLPPGGHIEIGELPEEAAIREVMEEAGIEIELVGERGLQHDYPGQPRQLIRPEGIQLESIGPDHEHIDLIYFARPRTDSDAMPPLIDGMAWVSEHDLVNADLNQEVRDWCVKALSAAEGWM
jgi:8-oxo-dGTP pyrophosphatase MutT (NUDIX family)